MRRKFGTISALAAIICGRGVAWLTHLPVTEKIAGSNPVDRAEIYMPG